MPIQTTEQQRWDWTRERTPLLLLAVMGLPLVVLLVGAMVDGQRRAQESPVAALMGVQGYQAWRATPTDDAAAVASPPFHYLAPHAVNERLRAPDFALPARDGSLWRLSEQRGKLVILNFWSITCRPCVEEMPSLVALGERLKDRHDVELVAISTDKDWETVAPLFRDLGEPPFRVLFDSDKDVVKGRFGTRAYPETWFVDGDGVIRMRVDGPRDWGQAAVLDLIDQWS